MPVLRALAFDDIDAVLVIQSASPEAAAWTRDSYEAICGGGPNRCIVAVRDEEPRAVVAFGCFRVLAPEAELLNLAVLPETRRQGVATMILREVMQLAAQAGAAKLFLEMRDSNAAASSLYTAFGFQPAGRRPGYYAHPSDAATIYRIDLTAIQTLPPENSHPGNLP